MSNIMKSWLRSVPLLYLIFLLSLLHLGYFVLHQRTESLTLFVLISTFVYLIYPNMVVVLASAMAGADLLYLAKSQEGFDGSMDLSMNLSQNLSQDISNNYSDVSNSFFDISGETFPGVPTNFLENAVKNIFKREPMVGDLKEVQAESNHIDKIIQTAKESSPELMESMKMKNSINIHEFNTLVNRLNTMIGNVMD